MKNDTNFDSNDPMEWLSDKWPVTKKGQVVSFNNDKYGLPPGITGYVEEHKEGFDRGGYVPTLYHNGSYLCYYDSEEGWLK